MELVRKLFSGCVIPRVENMNLHARSPDLVPCGYFLGGYLKAEVYKTHTKNLEALETAIVEKVTAIHCEVMDAKFQMTPYYLHKQWRHYVYNVFFSKEIFVLYYMLHINKFIFKHVFVYLLLFTSVPCI